jgi:RsiW-degrading membrane proteinase PrsW (M82 family)
MATARELRTQRRSPWPVAGWVRILLVGTMLWSACLVVIEVTTNSNLVPTLILLGSFLVPVSFLAWVFERARDEHVTTELVVRCFTVGGVLGVLSAAVLETYLLHPSPWLFLGVGLIEEAVKALTLLALTRRMARADAADGLILGAAVGFGFAALESAGYSFNALLTIQGLSLHDLVRTEMIRGLLAPLGHGLWSAVLGAVLFDRTVVGRARRGLLVLGTYLWVSLLHALWDSAHMIAVVLTLVWTGTPWQYDLLARGYLPRPTPEQAQLMSLLSNAGLVLIAVLGVATVERVRRRRVRPVPTPTRPRDVGAHALR